MQKAIQLLAIVSVISITTAAIASTFIVTKTADTADGTCDADCSLREAIIASNAAGGFDIVEVPPGTYLLDLVGAGDNASLTGDLDAVDDVLITGTGPGATIIDGNGTDHVISALTPGADVELRGLTIQNAAPNGLVNSSGSTLTVRNCTIRSNVNGISNGNGVTAIVIGSTISGNSNAGLGLDVASATTLINSTVTGSVTGIGGSPGTLTLTNTIVAGNSTNCSAGAAAVSNSSNSMDDDGTCLLGGPGDLSNIADAGLAPLQDNTGPTETHALCTGAMQPDPSCAVMSPAIDAGSNITCIAVDQRGLPRADGNADGQVRCDMGAFESQRSATLKCYKAKDLKNPKFVKIQNPGISLDDEFGLDADVDVKKPFLLCAPADKNGQGIVDETAHLCCYKIKGSKLDPPVEVEVADDFGSLELEVKKPAVMCQPCSSTVP